MSQLPEVMRGAATGRAFHRPANWTMSSDERRARCYSPGLSSSVFRPQPARVISFPLGMAPFGEDFPELGDDTPTSFRATAVRYRHGLCRLYGALIAPLGLHSPSTPPTTIWATQRRHCPCRRCAPSALKLAEHRSITCPARGAISYKATQ